MVRKLKFNPDGTRKLDDNFAESNRTGTTLETDWARPDDFARGKFQEQDKIRASRQNGVQPRIIAEAATPAWIFWALGGTIFALFALIAVLIIVMMY